MKIWNPRRSPDDAEYVLACAGLAVALYRRRRENDLALGLRYLVLARAAHARSGHGDKPPDLARALELYRKHSVAMASQLPLSARGNNTPRQPVLGRTGPPEVTRIRGSQIPTILRTPR